MKRLLGASLIAWHKLRPKLSIGDLDVSTSNPETRGLLYWEPNWKSDLIARVLALRPGLFVDVGANIGQTLLDYLSSAVRNGYVGLEPSLECARHIKAVIDANDLHDCKILPIALSDKAGIVDIFTTADADPGATIVPDLRPDLTNRADSIATLTYDQLSLPPASLIKIDVEGAELPVLKGMVETLKCNPPWILCEVLRRDSHADAEAFSRRMRATFTFLAEHKLSVWRVHKSPLGFEKVSAFPDEIYSAETADMNDYLLLPEGVAAPN